MLLSSLFRRSQKQNLDNILQLQRRVDFLWRLKAHKEHRRWFQQQKKTNIKLLKLAPDPKTPQKNTVVEI